MQEVELGNIMKSLLQLYVIQQIEPINVSEYI